MSSEAREGQIVGRYLLCDEIASGGMATVHLGRLMGPVGFSRTVAIKRLHPMYAKDPEFVAMLVDEARLAARIAHPNIVATIDVVTSAGELLLVMEYVKGESLAKLMRARPADNTAKVTSEPVRVPPAIVVRVIADVLYGLHAAHEATSERGEFLGLVHRDVSPQNVLVGTDGAARVVDFGIAKASFRVQNTTQGHVKGKLGYMPPEQLHGDPVDRRADIFAAATIAWEALVGKRLFGSEDSPGMLSRFRRERVCAPSDIINADKINADKIITRELDDVILRGLAEEPADRFATARQMALALEKALPPASAAEVGEWVEVTARDALVERAKLVAAIELLSPPLPKEEALEATPVPTPVEPQAAGAASLTAAGASIPSETRTRKRTGTRGPIVLAGVLIVLAGGLALAFAATRDRVRAPEPIASASANATAPEPSTSISASTLSSSLAVPLTSSSPPPAAPTSAATLSSAARVATPHAKPPPATPVKRNCDPPYTIGDRGFRIPKPQCL